MGPLLYLTHTMEHALNKQGLLKNILISFLPLLLFVAADEFLSDHYPEAEATRYALILAVGMGIIQAVYVFAKEKRLDKMILLDTGLIVALGSVSLFSGNDIFFKLKPALVQLVMVVFLGVLAFLKPQMLFAMSGRMMQGVEMGENQLKAMQQSAKGLVILLFFHTLLIAYAAFYLTKKDWAFISGPLIYILAALYFVGMVVVGRLKQRK